MENNLAEMERLVADCEKKRRELRSWWDAMLTTMRLANTYRVVNPADALAGAAVRLGLKTLAPGFLHTLKNIGLDPGKWAGGL